jgi:hypothetical protein
MSAFDDCTLAEIEMMQKECLGGLSMSDPKVDPMIVAGGMMWLVKRRENASLGWLDFKATTRMSDVKAFSIQMEADELDPTTGLSITQT